MKWFKQLLCKHQYSDPKSVLYDSGMAKYWYKTCKKCGRDKVCDWL